jgi:protein-S-isoprenylcysteine O-methyltransferase Ste14
MIYKILTLIIWILWLIVYWGWGINLLKIFIRSYKVKSYFYDKFFIIGLVILSNIMLWSGYISIRLNLNFEKILEIESLSILGFIMVLFGALLSFYGKIQMRESWSAYTKPNEKIVIIYKGLYSIVRHPIYLFSIIMNIGTFLVFPFYRNFICALLMIVLYILKMKFEVKMLINLFPEYKNYMKRVKYRLIPFLY